MSIVSIKLSIGILIALDALHPLWILNVLGYLLQNLHFIVGGFDVVRSTLHDLDSDVVVVLEVASEPDSRKVSPTQFLNEDIPVQEDFADEAGMIASHLVVLDAFVLTVVLFIQSVQKLVECPKLTYESYFGG